MRYKFEMNLPMPRETKNKLSQMLESVISAVIWDWWLMMMRCRIHPSNAIYNSTKDDDIVDHFPLKRFKIQTYFRIYMQCQKGNMKNIEYARERQM